MISSRRLENLVPRHLHVFVMQVHSDDNGSKSGFDLYILSPNPPDT